MCRRRVCPRLRPRWGTPGDLRNEFSVESNGLLSTSVLAMDYEFILKIAERRLKAALGRCDPGKILFTPATAVCICPERET